MTSVGRSRPVLPRAAWGFADQAVSAASNVLLTVVVARTYSAEDLGEFSLVYVLFALVLGLTRTTGGGVLAIEYADDQAALRRAVARSTGFSMGVGACLAVPGVALGLLLKDDLGPVLVVVSLALPLLLLQDGLRSYFFCQRRPQAAFFNDLVWGVGEVALFALVLSREGTPAMSTLVGCWAGAGAVAGLVGLVQSGVVPRPAPPLRWLRAHGKVAWPLVTSEVLTQLPAHVVYLTLPLVASVTQLGHLRAAYVFFGPLAVLNAGASMLALPHAVTMRRQGAVPALGRRVSRMLAGVSCLWTAVVVLLPERLGRAVVGDSWSGTAGTRFLLGVSLVAEAVLVGQVAALAALRDTRRLARIRTVSAPLTVLVALVLAALVGAPGAAAGFAAGYWVAAVLAWTLLLRRPPIGRRLVMPLRIAVDAS
ncbi:MAG TPA: hypothetical protein VMZ11_00990 [Mycobacteriales bacterium]|nr:hypothetical protein [Mycobacteriales bacterium]